jgi:hypothetical protein
MKIRLAIFSLVLIAGPFHAQNIFDEESTEAEPQPPEKPAKATSATDEPDDGEKAAVKVKKKRRARKKKKARREAAASTEYSPEAVARSSYIWAPEVEDITLTSTAPGIRAGKPVEATRALPAPVIEVPQEAGPPAQGFKLPQIPLAQVLIVAGFVILFLIYRFRVGRQIKRKRY